MKGTTSTSTTQTTFEVMGPQSGVSPAPDRVRVAHDGSLVQIERGDTGETRIGISEAEIGFLRGRLLTLIDATFTDPVQRKAFKDRVRSDILDWWEIQRGSAFHAAGQEFIGPRASVREWDDGA